MGDRSQKGASSTMPCCSISAAGIRKRGGRFERHVRIEIDVLRHQADGSAIKVFWKVHTERRQRPKGRGLAYGPLAYVSGPSPYSCTPDAASTFPGSFHELPFPGPSAESRGQAPCRRARAAIISQRPFCAKREPHAQTRASHPTKPSNRVR